ncbi:MAG: VOC family protein [Planctomycetes bacterium]|nr:VOC family protein [Planctomycetota bacterium]
MPAVKPVPDGFNTVSAYMVVRNTVEALEFYNKAFGAETKGRMPGPDGKSTAHAEMRIGNSTVMLTDENPQWGAKSPLTLGGTGVTLHIYVEDADALFKRAVAAGCTPTMPIMDAFWGDRYGKVTDPFGHGWGIATHKEDLTHEQVAKRAAEWFASMARGAPSK